MEEHSDKKSKGALPSNGLSFAQLSAYFSVGFITFMFLVHSNKTLIAKQKDIMSTSANYIYDPDHGVNMSHVCLSAKNVHQTKYKDSPCVNKTFIGWYNPWARHHSWKKLWKEKDEKRRERREMEKKKALEEEVMRKETEMETGKEEPTKTAEEPSGSKPLSRDNENMKKTGDGKAFAKKKEKQIEMLYAILIALVLMSTMAACWEVVKDRLKKKQAAELKAQEDRQCTLANFTINRHLRRESQQQTSSSLPRQSSFEKRSKVTQSFIHQSSLDRTSPMTTSEALNLRTERRYSVPASLLGDSNTANKMTAGSPSLLRVQRLSSSIDVTPDDGNLDARKKPRHIIRRH